ncbi:DEAD/DEAH box helicase family protein [Neobacillus rhizosphaerae]|uniref:DEAD/DEAH box helicase family protein n=1 Tax=Neobacillus rhizosphaerae TaxID=2880965 RepID=UPI003D2E63CD
MFELAEFQKKAIKDLTECVEDNKKEIVFKSPTGSGKTIVLTHFMDEYGKGHINNVFVWLTPGKGNLEEQSKAKMDKYIHNSQTKLITEVLTDGFYENDSCFINWEMLTKKGNNALKEGEKANFKERIKQAHKEGLEFIIVVDEAHQNDTVKADDIITMFKPKNIIRTTATPKNIGSAKLIEVMEEDVIAEGLIKKVLIINENFGNSIETDSQVNYLLEKALEKLDELKLAFEERDSIVNPLVVVQLPNNSELVQFEVENYLSTKDITYDNGLLAIWLSEQKEHLEDIEENDAKPIVILIKQAVATGWDCPRAHILVKLRDSSSETFEIQTIGRIRRMPEAKHYESDLLDSCYLYTFDEDYTEGVRTSLGKGALDADTLFLKEEHRGVILTSEQKSVLGTASDATQSLKTMLEFYKTTYGTGTKSAENIIRLEHNGYRFSEKIVKTTFTGQVHKLTKQEFENLTAIEMVEPLNTHKHGREYHNRVGKLGGKVGLSYDKMNTIIRRLFDKSVKYDNKILSLETKDVYAFVINNYYKLAEDFQIANASLTLQISAALPVVVEKEFRFPLEFQFTYSKKNRVQKEYKNNVYKGYLSSAEKRSDSEKSFEKYCNDSSEVEWFYKNGDKGSEYFSIVYVDNNGTQRSFYPDYIVSKDGETWIIETKGGFNRTGESEDIDKFSPKKFEVLKRYLDKYNLKGGFVRKDKSNNELFICMNEYNDDISSDEWQLLEEVL